MSAEAPVLAFDSYRPKKSDGKLRAATSWLGRVGLGVSKLSSEIDEPIAQTIDLQERRKHKEAEKAAETLFSYLDEIDPDKSLFPSEFTFVDVTDQFGTDGFITQEKELFSDKIPAGIWQYGEVWFALKEADDAGVLGYVLGAGRTWFFTTFKEALENGDQYAFGFARGYIGEKGSDANAQSPVAA